VSLAKVMEGASVNRGSGTGIFAQLDGHTLTYVPLYHPSWSHKNMYAGDYDSLRQALCTVQDCAP
jgi:hypothetical protein